MTDRVRDLKVVVVSGVATVLATRAFLAATGYPKLGGSGGIHVAHMLWGGLLMLGGLFVLLTLLGQTARRWGAVVGGVGFGLFIDEVGKQVNQAGYFYRPAAGIIYLVFAVLAVLVWRWEPRPGSPEARRAWAADVAVTGLLRGLTERQRLEAIQRLPASDDAADQALRQLLTAVPAREPGWQGWAAIRTVADRVAAHPIVRAAAVGYAILQGILLLVGITGDALAGSLAHEREWGSVGALAVCTAFSAVVGLRGALLLRRDRGRAFGLLRTSVLIELLAGQTFNFTVNQFSAVTAWLFGLATLWVVAAEAERLQSAPLDQKI